MLEINRYYEIGWKNTQQELSFEIHQIVEDIDDGKETVKHVFSVRKVLSPWENIQLHVVEHEIKKFQRKEQEIEHWTLEHKFWDKEPSQDVVRFIQDAITKIFTPDKRLIVRPHLDVNINISRRGKIEIGEYIYEDNHEITVLRLELSRY